MLQKRAAVALSMHSLFEARAKYSTYHIETHLQIKPFLRKNVKGWQRETMCHAVLDRFRRQTKLDRAARLVGTNAKHKGVSVNREVHTRDASVSIFFPFPVEFVPLHAYDAGCDRKIQGPTASPNIPR